MRKYQNKVKKHKTFILSIILLLTLTLSLLQVTTSLPYNFHNGWIVSSGDKVQYSVAYTTTTATNSVIASLIKELNLSVTEPARLVLSTPLVSSNNLTEIAIRVLGFDGTIKISIETGNETVDVKDLLLPIAIPIVNWEKLIEEFNRLQDTYITINATYSFFNKHFILNFTQKTATAITTFVFMWSTDFGILESFYCTVVTQNLSEQLLLVETQRSLNYKNELRGHFLYFVDYASFLIPAVANFFIPLILFTQLDYGKKGIFRYINPEKLGFLKRYKDKDELLNRYIRLFLFFICVALIYGFLLGVSFRGRPEYKYIPLFSLQMFFPLVFGLILSTYEINALGLPEEEGAIVIIYPCYGYITGVVISDLLSLPWNQTILYLLFLVALFAVLAYHIRKLKQKNAM